MPRDRALVEWDCRDCPIARDLLRWLDELSAQNAGLRFRNNQLQQRLAATVRR
ncbi:MAG: hypothetical protein A4E48_00448 [Methanosaeta sp. PtaU1.Bin060]|nr:MAG: hypothetical protein A4E48_00448 [Methanosaeta sp. PtaU1.Bin060]